MNTLRVINIIKKNIKKYPLVENIAHEIYKVMKSNDLRRAIHWMCAGHIIRYQRIRVWLRGSQSKYLQIGGGRHVKVGDHWMNGDLIAGEAHLNATKKLPFPDNSLDIIFTEQFIEHLHQQGASYFLSEAYRVLKPGGFIRQSTPDLDKLVYLYMNMNLEVSLDNVIDRHIRNHRRDVDWVQRTGCQFINDIFRLWGHQYIYDSESLVNLHCKAGFESIKLVRFGESDIQELEGLERHADEEWMKNAFVTVIQAQKPCCD